MYRASVSRFIWRGADTLHFLLPRTTEADYITSSLKGRDEDESQPGGDEWALRTFTWDAPLRFNLWFSLASSVLFAALVLGLAWAKLRTVDF